LTLKRVRHAAHVIAVPMRHDDEVQLRQVDALGLRVLRQDVRVVAGVEQDALAAIFHQRGVAPILLHRRALAKGVVKDGDLRLGRIGGCRRRRRGRARRAAGE
jgi:hypothetical protein